MIDSGQKQVSSAFGYKWNRHVDFGVSGASAEVMHRWTLDLLGWSSDDAYAAYLLDKRRILDAGCGNGRDLLTLARLAPHAAVFGLDISDAVCAAKMNTREVPNVTVVQGNLCGAPDDIGIFDYITSMGVLHHTLTHAAFSALCQLLAPGGEFAFYIYRRKAPIREFTDDMVRAQIREMAPEEAWREMEGITAFGREVARLNATIEIPEVRVLGIEAGRHNLQRLMYYTMLKFYWRDDFSFDQNVHVNYDWYYPEYSWRHTAEEVRSWIAEIGFKEQFANRTSAGLCFRIRKPS